MRDTGVMSRWRSRTAALSVLLLGLSACSGGGSQVGGAAAPAQKAQPVSISVTPAGGAEANPTTPIVVKAANGTLTTVTVTNPKGSPVNGGMSPDRTTW